MPTPFSGRAEHRRRRQDSYNQARGRGATVAAAAQTLGITRGHAVAYYEPRYQTHLQDLADAYEAALDRAAAGPRSRDEHWTAAALCGHPGLDPDMWSPPNLSQMDSDHPAVRPAIRICRGCQVRQECRDDAIRSGERETIRGGHTPRELARLAEAVTA